MKKKLSILMLLVIFFLSSCKQSLEEEMYSQVTDNHLNTPAGFEDGVRASYVPLRSFYGVEAGFTVTVFGTDTYTMGRDGSYKAFNQYTSQLNPSEVILKNIWRDFYQGINTCNAVISRTESAAVAPEIKKKRLAEVRFLRAHYYFILVQMFGPVHLSLEEVKGVAISAQRTPIGEIYKTIVGDLEQAIIDLPIIPDMYGRVTKPAAEHLLSRVLLTRASSDAAEKDDYTKAAEYAIKVIKNYNFKLLSNFGDVFLPEPGDRNAEIVWAVQYTSNQRANGEGNRGHFFYVMDYRTLSLGVTNSINNGRPWTRFRPTDFTLETLFKDRVNDTRYEKTFQTVYYCNSPRTVTLKNGKQVSLALGDTAIWLPGFNLPDADAFKKNYEVLRPKDYSSQWYPTLTKFLDINLPNLGENRGSRDFLAFRLAETYLIAAEALLLSGKNTEALEYINMIRGRAARQSSDPAVARRYSDAMKIDGKDLTLDFILDERGRELLGEQFRWFDLVRTKKLLERVKLYNRDAATNIKDFHSLRPIPQEQIDRTEGGNDAFPQNTGY